MFAQPHRRAFDDAHTQPNHIMACHGGSVSLDSGKVTRTSQRFLLHSQLWTVTRLKTV